MTSPLVIVQDQGTRMPALMGRDWLEKLKIDWKTVCSMSTGQGVDERVERLRKKFPEVLRNTPGMVKNFEAHIILKGNARLVFAKARPIPFAVKEALGKKLEKLDEDEIVERVTKRD